MNVTLQESLKPDGIDVHTIELAQSMLKLFLPDVKSQFITQDGKWQPVHSV